MDYKEVPVMEDIEAYRQATASLQAVRETNVNKLFPIRSARSCFRWCSRTRRLNQVGYGFRRSTRDKPIKGKVVLSFTCRGGGGYLIERLEDPHKGNLIQVQAFRTADELDELMRKGVR